MYRTDPSALQVEVSWTLRVVSYCSLQFSRRFSSGRSIGSHPTYMDRFWFTSEAAEEAIAVEFRS